MAGPSIAPPRKLELGLALLLLAFTLYVLWPLLDVVVAGAILAYVMRPIDEQLRRRVRFPGLSAALTTLVLAGPLLLLMTYAAYSVLVDVGEMIAEFDTSSTGEVVLRRFLPANARTALKPMVGAVGSALEGYAAALPLALVKLIIMFATMFYCLTSGQAVEVYLRSIVPARLRPWLDVLWVPVSNVLRGMLYGHLVSSLILGALGGVGYAILGFQYAALLGALTAVAAMLPIVGPYAVFTPLAAAEFVTGSPLKAVAVLLYGIVVLTAYANFYMYPKLGGNYAGIHPLLVLIAFLAGPFAMGPTGLIFGPLAMGLAIGLAECVRLWSASARVEAATDHG